MNIKKIGHPRLVVVYWDLLKRFSGDDDDGLILTNKYFYVRFSC